MTAVSVFPVTHLPFFLMAELFIVIAGCAHDQEPGSPEPSGSGAGNHSFVVIDPGHFHSSLVFTRSGYDGISHDVAIYAPVGDDFVDHMNRVIPFNTRKDDPADWRYRIYLGPDYRDAIFRERFGDIAILSGKNNVKIEIIKACIDSGFNVLADKPWIIEPSKFSLLETVLTEAEQKGLVAYDIMTERFEVTSILQRIIVGYEPVFGTITSGSSDDPAVVKSSVHYLSKVVAGQQLKRPWWFFDTSIQGEGLVDITTHLVDMVFWILYPAQSVDYKTDIDMVSAKHWPTMLTPAQYETITAQPRFPEHFTLDKDSNYPYYCNGQVNFRVKGVNVRIEVIWNYEAPKGSGDTIYSIIKGTKCRVLVLQGKDQNFKPELYIEPSQGSDRSIIKKELASFIDSLDQYPGLNVIEENGRWRIDIPDKYRVSHEAHFGQVTDRFLNFLAGDPMPLWEKANMLAKYYVTTKALALCLK